MNWLHTHHDFKSLLEITAIEEEINASLVEKDYWIMHCLYSLQNVNYNFVMKGGTSLSKGFKLIDRFSEDIDMWIEPDPSLNVFTGRNHTKPVHCESRKKFYNLLAEDLKDKISGINEIRRDEEYDDCRYFRSGGIRVHYQTLFSNVEGLKEGILLEVGFDNVEPNEEVTISSWAYEKAKEANISIFDNRARNIRCYDARYTFVEKL